MMNKLATLILICLASAIGTSTSWAGGGYYNPDDPVTMAKDRAELARAIKAFSTKAKTPAQHLAEHASDVQICIDAFKALNIRAIKEAHSFYKKIPSIAIQKTEAEIASTRGDYTDEGRAEMRTWIPQLRSLVK